jgi:hypothetical protein
MKNRTKDDPAFVVAVAAMDEFLRISLCEEDAVSAAFDTLLSTLERLHGKRAFDQAQFNKVWLEMRVLVEQAIFEKQTVN